MRIQDVNVGDVIAGRNWRLRSDVNVFENMLDWEIEECDAFGQTEVVVYSALSALDSGEVRAILVVREVGSYEWWGDTCEYVAGRWRQIVGGEEPARESYVAAPLPEDPSFMGEYSHEKQRAGFERLRERIRVGAGA